MEIAKTEELEQIIRTEISNLLRQGGQETETLPPSVQNGALAGFHGDCNSLEVCECPSTLYPQATGRAISRQQWVSVIQKRRSNSYCKLNKMNIMGARRQTYR